MKYISSVLLILIISFYCAYAHKSKTQQSKKKNTPTFSETLLNVHLVPHTHDDVGWLKTVDQYYMGLNNTIYHAGVQYILDSVILALQQNPDRKFIYVEIAFFSRWWNQQDDETKSIVRSLVSNNQLEFINGGLTMNDEAATFYTDIIDQMTLGHQWLLKEFGQDAIPKVAWHIDPFGHSAEQATLFALMGFEAFFFGRIDYQDKMQRLQTQNMEYIWRASPSLGKSAEIFAGVTFNGYSPPKGFDWDQKGNDQPIQDDQRLNGYNVDYECQQFAGLMMQQNLSYLGNHIMVTMGDDFMYENANTWFKNLDKLIKYCNESPEKYGLNLFYSTPSIYLEAKHSLNLTWNVKYDDNFPYCDQPDACWTGYFTSRPSLKSYVRDLSTQLQICKQADVWQMTKNLPELPGNASILADAMGIAQHHDAVSGTSKQHVAFDYAQRLSVGQAQCDSNVNNLLQSLTIDANTDPIYTPLFVQCDLLNVSFCEATELWDGTSTLIFNVYNDLGAARSVFVHFPFSQSTGFQIVDASNTPVLFQVNELSDVDMNLQFQVSGTSNSNFSVSFLAMLPAVGFNTYFLVPANVSDALAKVDPVTSDFIYLSNQQISLVVSGATGRFFYINNKFDGSVVKLDQNWAFYNSSIGDSISSQSSGAYLFRPQQDEANSISDSVSIVVTRGALYDEVFQVFSNFVSQRSRVYHSTSDYIEVEYTVGPLPIDDGIGKEVIIQFNTSIDSEGQFLTDSNGRSIQQRLINFRPTWNLIVNEPISQNYYPVNSVISINDDETQFSILVDRSQAGGSISNGEIELMAHRRLTHDDHRGVNEPLNELGLDGKGLITRGRYRLLLNSPINSAKSMRSNSLDLSHNARIGFAKMPSFFSVADYEKAFISQTSFLRDNLPPNIHLQTLEILPNSPHQVLLRLAHLFSINEDSTLSKSVTLDLASLFTSSFSDVVETTLSANRNLSSFSPLLWNTINDSADNNSFITTLDGTNVTLSPMEIRTYILNF